MPSLTLWLTDVSALRRNAVLALGNLRDPAAVPALVEMLGYTEPQVRSYTAWALGRIGGREAREALARALSNEADLEVKEEMKTVLEESPKV